MTTTAPRRSRRSRRPRLPRLPRVGAAGVRRAALGGLAGLAAGALTLALADFVAQVVVDPAATPLIAVGETFIDLTPLRLKEFAVETFGTNDKLVLLLSMGVVVATLAAAAGMLVRHRPAAATVLVVLLGTAAAAAALTRPGAVPLDGLPAGVGTAGGLAALLLAGRALRGDAPASGQGADGEPDRRTALRALAGTAGAAVLVGGSGRLVATRAGHGTGPSNVTLPRPQDAAAIPGAATVGVAGVTPFVTSASAFYRIDTALVVPRIDAAAWRLRIHGLVDRELSLDYRSLLAIPLVERTVTLTCVSNEVGGTLAGNATWLGVPLAEVLRRVGVRPEADMVLSGSSDGFTASTPLTALTDGRDALLAVGMNGAPLPYEHGFPVRMVVPGLYGYVSATKWVTSLEVTRFDRAQAYWTRRGYAAQAPIKTFSRIDVPRPFAQLDAGRVAVGGVAWAQHRGIRAVQVRVDGGPWSRAGLGAVPGLDTWRQWAWTWDAAPGLHRLEVRATDVPGDTQPQTRTPPVPNGATGWHSVTVTVTG